MKKFIGLLMLIAPIATLAFWIVPEVFNNGKMTVASIIASLSIGVLYTIIALGLYDAEEE